MAQANIFTKTMLAKPILSKLPITINEKKPTIGNTLPEFISKQTQRVQTSIKRKAQSQQKINSIIEANIKKRQQLKAKIATKQQNNDKKRQELLKVKLQNINLKKSEQTFKKNIKNDMEKNQLIRAKSNYEKQRKQMENYWDSYIEKSQEKNKKDTSIKLLYGKAVEQKKILQKNEVIDSDIKKQKFIERHKDIRNRMTDMIQQKLAVFDTHKEMISSALVKSSQSHEKKVEALVDNLVKSQYSSQRHLKKLNKERDTNIKNKLIDRNELIRRTKSNYFEKNRQLQSGSVLKNQSLTLTNSVNLKRTSSQLDNTQSPTKLKRSDSIRKGQEKLKIVKNNIEELKSKQQLKNEMIMMKSKEIGQALRIRESIKNQSNLLVRRAKRLKFLDDMDETQSVKSKEKQASNQIIQ